MSVTNFRPEHFNTNKHNYNHFADEFSIVNPYSRDLLALLNKSVLFRR